MGPPARLVAPVVVSVALPETAMSAASKPVTDSPKSTWKLIVSAFVGLVWVEVMTGSGREPSYVMEYLAVAVLALPTVSRAAPAAMSTRMAPWAAGTTSNV